MEWKFLEKSAIRFFLNYQGRLFALFLLNTNITSIRENGRQIPSFLKIHYQIFTEIINRGDMTYK
jgi:hypothetical protein